jgi:hypothetical protein|tara:strand:- start:1135 stop:1671 length:537 start_codon:yes stop_codon:yes gene_type:complete
VTHTQLTLEQRLDQRFGLVEADDTRRGVNTMSKSYGRRGRESVLRDRVIEALRTAPKGDLSTDEVVEALDYPNRGSVQATLSDCHRLGHIPVMRVGKATYRYIQPAPDPTDEVSHLARLEQRVNVLIQPERKKLCPGDLLEVVYVTRTGVTLALDESNNLLALNCKVLSNLADPALQV